MNALPTHARIRLAAVFRDPWALTVVLGTGLLTLVMWPSPMPASGPVLRFAGEPEPASLATMFVFMWIWMWPALAGPVIGGRSAVGGLGSALAIQPNPALPIGARGRIVAEVALLIGIVLLIRAPGLLVGEWIHSILALPGAYAGDAAWMASFATRSLVGAAIMLPSAVAWVIPCGNPQVLVARSGVVVVVEMTAMWLGLLATPLAAVTTGLVLAAAQLPLVGREWRLGSTLQWQGRAPFSLSRPALPPHRQLVHDFILRPLPVALALLAAQALLIVADAAVLPEVHLVGEEGPGLLYMGSSLMLGLSIGFLALRPMRSSVAVAGMLGKAGYRAGDFATAWATLPVRRESVLRAVYLHGLITSGAIWAAAIATAVVSTWLDTGAFDATQLFGGEPGLLLVPMVAVVPCIAGLLTAGAAGRKGLILLSGMTMISVFHGHFILLILKTPTAIHAAALFLAAALGGGPIVTELVTPRRRWR